MIMDWKDTIAKVANAAPMIGSLLGAPGIAIGGIVKLVASALGVEPSEEALEAEIRQNPEALLKLKEFEAAHRIELEKLALEAERIRLADVQSARDREIKIVQATGKRDYSMEVLGWIITVGFFGILIVRMCVTIEYTQLESIGQLTGGLIAAFTTVVQYKYGSSKGSADKTATMVATLGGEKKG
jgi:hypothetical protein